MFTRCLTCDSPFQPNEVLEHLPLSERVAFDPGRGRLWVICRRCRRWTLAPIEDRWEALEELDKLTRDRARLLSSTDNIALYSQGPIDIVRVGKANLTEQAWWRYGRELVDRRRTFKRLSFAGSVGAGAVIVGGWSTGAIGGFMAWWLWSSLSDTVPKTARWLRFGGEAWRGQRHCIRCGRTLQGIDFKRRKGLILRSAAGGGGIEVVRPCPTCLRRRESGLVLSGPEGERVVRRVLAYHHHQGASEQRVRSATRLIEEAGSPEHLNANVLGAGSPLGQLTRTDAIALEISANDEAEQRLLRLELAELEARWREEEELAAIMDGELTPLPLLEEIRRRLITK